MMLPFGHVVQFLSHLLEEIDLVFDGVKIDWRNIFRVHLLMQLKDLKLFEFILLLKFV